MTWLEVKKRLRELGIRNSDQTGFKKIDDNGYAHFEINSFTVNTLSIPMVPKHIPTKKRRRA